MNKKAIPSILAVILLLLGVGGGVLLVNREQVFRIGASPELTPRDVRLSNITTNSFTVTWVTDSPTVGFLNWGETSNLGNTQQTQTASSPTVVHTATIQGLTRGRTYYFAVNSNGAAFLNNGAPYSQITQSQNTPGESFRMSGAVVDQSGSPVGGAVVFATIGKNVWSVQASATGNWILNAVSTDTNPEVDIFVQAGPAGISAAKANAANANPLPVLTLGKTHDFRGSGSTTLDSSLSQGQVQTSGQTREATNRLNTQATTQTTSQSTTNVTLRSVENGETVSTTRPQFFGDAPANTRIEITINSPIKLSGTTTSASDGRWSYTPTTDLPEGNHTITLKWFDASGVAKTLTRTFVVDVDAQTPAFESSPTGTLRPQATTTPRATASPTASIRPTQTATPTPVSSVSATPKKTIAPTPIATVSALPEAGAPWAAIALGTFGAIMTFAGIAISRKNY